MQRHGWKTPLPRRGAGPGPRPARPRRLPACSATAGRAETSPSSPCPSRRCAPASCAPLQRLSYFASLAAYLAPPMRLLLLLTLALVLWTGELPMKVSVLALAALWLPSGLLNLLAGSALARGYMRIGETAHYELMTMEIYTRALRCVFRPGRTAFKVTPKQGSRRRRARRGPRLQPGASLPPSLLTAGTVMRLLDLGGVGPLPDLPGVADRASCPCSACRAAPGAAHPAGPSAGAVSGAWSTASRETRRPPSARGRGPVVERTAGRRQRRRDRPGRRCAARGRQPARPSCSS